MNRTITRTNKGESLVTETITLTNTILTEPQSIESYYEMFNLLKAALDYGLLRNAKNAPDKITCSHNGNIWVIKVDTTFEEVK
jgi:hypothetical protein